MFGILLAGIAPGLALLSYFYLKDKYEPEPVLMVFRTFIFGAILLFPIAFIEYILKTEHVITTNAGNAFFSSGMTEEFFKWALLLLAVYWHKEFDEPFDGIVYGTSVSLGFATAENIMYLMVNGSEIALNRATMTVSGHALFGVIMGYYISRAKFAQKSKWPWMLMSILIPTFLHGVFNYILLIEKSWLMFMIPYMILLWWLALRKVQTAETLSRNHFSNLYNLQKGTVLKYS